MDRKIKEAVQDKKSPKPSAESAPQITQHEPEQSENSDDKEPAQDPGEESGSIENE